MRFPWSILAAVVAVHLCACVPDRRQCEAIDVSGQWLEVGRPLEERSTLSIGGASVTDITVQWARAGLYPDEEDANTQIMWLKDREDALGTVTLGDGDAIDPLGDNLSPETNTTELHVQGGNWGCTLSFPQTWCELRYRLKLRGRAGTSRLVGTFEVWRKDWVTPLSSSLRRIYSTDVEFVRNTLLAESVACPSPFGPGGTDGGVDAGVSSSGGASSGVPMAGRQTGLFPVEDLPTSPAEPSVSADGRLIVFAAEDAETNWTRQIFLHDRATLDVRRLTSGQGASSAPVISADGQVVAFVSEDPDLVEGDTNGVADVFVMEVERGAPVLVSAGRNGVPADGPSAQPAINADGTVVAFTSHATNLVISDANGVADVFVRDVSAGRTMRGSVESQGVELAAASGHPSVSASGRFVLFESDSALDDGDTNSGRDVFVHDVYSAQVTRLSLVEDVASHSPVVDPYAEWAVFVAERADGTSRVVRVKLDGSERLELDVGGVVEAPRLSALGRHVAFTHQADEGLRTVRGWSEVLPHANAITALPAETPALAADGSTLSFVTTSTPRTVWVHALQPILPTAGAARATLEADADALHVRVADTDAALAAYLAAGGGQAEPVVTEWNHARSLLVSALEVADAVLANRQASDVRVWDALGALKRAVAVGDPAVHAERLAR